MKQRRIIIICMFMVCFIFWQPWLIFVLWNLYGIYSEYSNIITLVDGKDISDKLRKDITSGIFIFIGRVNMNDIPGYVPRPRRRYYVLPNVIDFANNLHRNNIQNAHRNYINNNYRPRNYINNNYRPRNYN